MGEWRNAYGILMGKPERKAPLGRRKRGSEDRVNMDHKEIGCNDMNWLLIGTSGRLL
jgi:hypothetical protein